MNLLLSINIIRGREVLDLSLLYNILEISPSKGINSQCKIDSLVRGNNSLA